MPIFQKINLVMKEVSGVEKASFNQHAKFHYAGHEAVTAALRHSFSKHGIVRFASVSSFQVLEGGVVQAMVRVSYVDTEDTSRLDIDMPALQPSQTSKGGLTAQQIGQAVSYAVKNVEFKLFALTGDTEEDADALPAEHQADGLNDTTDNVGAMRQRSQELLAAFEMAPTADAVQAINAKLRAEWSALRVVPGLAEDIVKHRERALERVRSSVRQPGEEG